MSDAIAEYLGRLGRHEIAVAEALPPAAKGTIRLDIERDTGVDHWFVTLGKGKVQVSREDRAASTVIRGHHDIFDRLARGEAHILASLFRNEVSLEGDLTLMDFLLRLLPGPPGSHHPRDFARMPGRQS